MSEDELKKRQHLHERTRDEIAANTRSMAENLDRSLLALSSAFLGGSLAFINQVVKVETAAFKWLLYASWIFFAATIALTITSLILGVLQMRPLQVAAERYYIKGDASAWGVSDRLQRRTFLWVMACGVTFILGILSLAAFVLLNLV
jgi:amino acid transporter